MRRATLTALAALACLSAQGVTGASAQGLPRLPDLPAPVRAYLEHALSGHGARGGQPDRVARQAPSPSGEPLMGRASVVDGDTLDIHGTRVRMFGIDAPESAQTCERADGSPYRCGKDAANALDARIADRPVRCVARDTDRYGRTVAVCSVGGEDLNAWMVRSGLAVAYTRYGADYEGQEREAKAARRGLWAGRFEDPSEFRSARRGR